MSTNQSNRPSKKNQQKSCLEDQTRKAEKKAGKEPAVSV